VRDALPFLQRLEENALARKQLDEAEYLLVKHAHELGESWYAIADALGVSPAEVHRKYGNLDAVARPL
jgi:hypothetical protein